MFGQKLEPLGLKPQVQGVSNDRMELDYVSIEYLQVSVGPAHLKSGPE
jgi:hypothetical protein